MAAVCLGGEFYVGSEWVLDVVLRFILHKGKPPKARNLIHRAHRKETRIFMKRQTSEVDAVAVPVPSPAFSCSVQDFHKLGFRGRRRPHPLPVLAPRRMSSATWMEEEHVAGSWTATSLLTSPGLLNFSSISLSFPRLGLTSPKRAGRVCGGATGVLQLLNPRYDFKPKGLSLMDT